MLQNLLLLSICFNNANTDLLSTKLYNMIEMWIASSVIIKARSFEMIMNGKWVGFEKVKGEILPLISYVCS